MELLTDRRVSVRNGGYYLAGSRISLDSVAWCLRHGETIEEILDNFPGLEEYWGAARAREMVEDAVAFIREHPEHIDEYLEEGKRRWEELKRQNPYQPEFEEKMRKFKEQKGLKLA